MAEAIAAPDFAFGDDSIIGDIIDFATPDNALELGPFAGISILDGALAFLCIQCTIDQQTTAKTVHQLHSLSVSPLGLGVWAAFGLVCGLWLCFD